MIHGGSRLVIVRSGVGEEIGGVQSRSVPQFVQASVKPVGSGFRDIVDLCGSIAPLVDGVGEGVYRDFGNGIEAQDEIGRKAAIEVGERIVGFQSVHDVAVRKRRQAIELNVAVTVRASQEVVTAAGNVQ